MLLSISLFGLSMANAQNMDTSAPDNIQYKNITELEFGEELNIDGELVSPNGSVVSEAIRPDFNPLLSLRMDFQQELNQSVNLIK